MHEVFYAVEHRSLRCGKKTAVPHTPHAFALHINYNNNRVTLLWHSYHFSVTDVIVLTVTYVFVSY